MNKIKTILILFAMLLLMTVAGEVVLGVLFPGYVGKAHLAVPLLFLALYAVPVAVMASPADTKHFVKQYFIFKSFKLLLSFGALLAMCFIFKEQTTGVLINFLVYCLVMLVVENVFVLKLKNKINISA